MDNYNRTKGADRFQDSHILGVIIMNFPNLLKKLGQRQRPTLGLDIGSHTIKLVEFSKDRTLRRIGRALVPPQAIVDGSIKKPDELAQVLKALIDNLQPKARYVATSIAGYSVIIKKIDIPYKDEKEIEDNLLFEAEEYIPFEIEDVYIDFHSLGKGNKDDSGTEIFLVAAKKDMVNEYANLIQEVGLFPAVVDVEAFALGNAFEDASAAPTKPVALVDLGAQKTNFNIIGQGTSLFAKDIAFGGTQITEAIQEATGLGYEDAEKVKIAGDKDLALMKEVASVCRELSGVWATELKKTIDFYNASSKKEEQPTQIFISGGSAFLKGLDMLFSNEIGLSVKIFNPLQRFQAAQDIEPDYLSAIAPQMTIATGLALRTVIK